MVFLLCLALSGNLTRLYRLGFLSMPCSRQLLQRLRSFDLYWNKLLMLPGCHINSVDKFKFIEIHGHNFFFGITPFEFYCSKPFPHFNGNQFHYFLPGCQTPVDGRSNNSLANCCWVSVDPPRMFLFLVMGFKCHPAQGRNVHRMLVKATIFQSEHVFFDKMGWGLLKPPILFPLVGARIPGGWCRIFLCGCSLDF